MPHDVKVDIRLFVMKPLHARWVIDFYEYMSSQKGRKIVVNGFKKAGIRGAFDQASKLRELQDNPFTELDMECDLQVFSGTVLHSYSCYSFLPIHTF